MAITKSHAFSNDVQQLAAYAKALSHPARIEILKILAERNACICGEIVEVLPLAQSTVSQHLKELLAAGLIKGTIDGPKSCYCINADTITLLASQMATLFAGLAVTPNTANQCC